MSSLIACVQRVQCCNVLASHQLPRRCAGAPSAAEAQKMDQQSHRCPLPALSATAAAALVKELSQNPPSS